MPWWNPLSITRLTQKNWRLTSICFLHQRIVKLFARRSLKHLISYKFMSLSTYWQWKLANDSATISAVVVKLTINHFLNLVTVLIRKSSTNYKKMWKFTLTQKNNEFPPKLDVNNLGGWKFDTKKELPLLMSASQVKPLIRLSLKIKNSTNVILLSWGPMGRSDSKSFGKHFLPPICSENNTIHFYLTKYLTVVIRQAKQEHKARDNLVLTSLITNLWLHGQLF